MGAADYAEIKTLVLFRLVGVVEIIEHTVYYVAFLGRGFLHDRSGG